MSREAQAPGPLSGGGSSEGPPPPTEDVNPASLGIDRKSARQIVETIHREDLVAWRALDGALDAIESVASAVERAFRAGGRLIYVGAGTSGRLGVLDASECPPTFGADPSMVIGIIAGGEDALRLAVEGAEDDAGAGARAVQDSVVGESDVVCGIAASGSTPFVRGALLESRIRGATTALVTSNTRLQDRELLGAVDQLVCLATGAEIVAGSTRMKSGTATKMALNMITTTAMIRLGKVHDNLMVDLRASNRKLRARAVRLVERVAGVGSQRARQLLDSAGDVKTAIVMHVRGLAPPEARAELQRVHGHLRSAIESP